MRNILGYVLGGLMFVLFVPAIMWFASLMPEFWIGSVWRVAVADTAGQMLQIENQPITISRCCFL